MLPANRNKLIKTIHAIKHAIGMDESDYRSLMKRTTDQESLKELSELELSLLAMQLKALSFSHEAQSKRKVGLGKSARIQKIHALLKVMGKSKTYALGIAKHMFRKEKPQGLKGSKLEDLNEAQLYKIIASLVYHQRRQEKKNKDQDKEQSKKQGKNNPPQKGAIA